MEQTAKTIVVSGKGGVGKTTLTALLVDELVTLRPQDRILVIDGDPDMNLHLSLGIPEPPAAIADVRDEDYSAGAIRASGLIAHEYAAKLLEEKGVIQSYPNYDFMTMGHSRETGCYCAVNNALAKVFAHVAEVYDWIVTDSPAGTEHLNRYRIKHADLFLIIGLPNPASRAVAQRIEEAIERTGMTTTSLVHVHNQCAETQSMDTKEGRVCLPVDEEIAAMSFEGEPVVAMGGDNPVRVSVRMMLSDAVFISASGA
ncbi:MAG: AAA family ATPase [Chloroflexi bacterium]|nr:AAA family ATPase [Chloroflexota bacterium]